jgi:hypothetical protein
VRQGNGEPCERNPAPGLVCCENNCVEVLPGPAEHKRGAYRFRGEHSTTEDEGNRRIDTRRRREVGGHIKVPKRTLECQEDTEGSIGLGRRWSKPRPEAGFDCDRSHQVG